MNWWIILGNGESSSRWKFSGNGRDGDKSSQQALLSDKGIVDNSQLNLVNKVLPPKWFTKVKIVVSHDYHFTVIAMIDSGADMNCI